METENKYDNAVVKVDCDKKFSLNKLRICFCIDTSNSTKSLFVQTKEWGMTYLDVEKLFVMKMAEKLSYPESVTYIGWNKEACQVDCIKNLVQQRGTNPSCLFENDTSYHIVSNSDIVFLITDGIISNEDVNMFHQHMKSRGIQLKAIIGVIVGRRTNTNETYFQIKPADINVSVIAPATIANSCILFYNMKTVYVVWASGDFENILQPNSITKETLWSDVTTTSFKDLSEISLTFPNDKIHNSLIKNEYIHLGKGNYFNPVKLLVSKPTFHELIEYPFSQICQYFKITQSYDKLYLWFKNLCKEKLEILCQQSLCSIKNMIVKSSDNTFQFCNPYYKPLFIIERNKLFVYKYILNNAINFNLKSLLFNSEERSIMEFIRGIYGTMQEDMISSNVDSDYLAMNISRDRYKSFTKKTSTEYDYFKNNKSISKNEILFDNNNFKDVILWINLFNNNLHESVKPNENCSLCGDQGIGCVVIKKFLNLSNDEIIDNPVDHIYPKILCEKCAVCFCNYQIDTAKYYAAIPIVKPREEINHLIMNMIMCLMNGFFIKYFASMNDKVLSLFSTIIESLVGRNISTFDMINDTNCDDVNDHDGIHMQE
ncbi:hypothetical protein [Acanthamoeba castellanii mimivirus]|jgi:hypothetical protein|uniref:Uncharacterized protein R626 n=5 Tax=Mimivirus TaxID=315393 RepID=YR626_MIMIV|nr:hypothetical protein MIMI_gp0673 [Acanthamoeba polyphaga mimivirus]Q5UR70.1 RecName: Full=Uncharacterized protein R626 [Acanthamoeba polyphaga mimivirus]ALR84214.1 hypothetical protein [Niemeyer virus]AMK61976.1 hypothetical protein [Samba virus]AMZ03069.1 hypothetical protein [Mimivirus Bombay]BAV61742.1 hypothetical protein [Acanthamoeba castellanii mimivirus]AAV50887.1 unknown [Acanthamoeba polyphaga mimivirus]